MIVGNPRPARTLLIVSIAMAALILISAAFFASRKKADPQKEPPLHPTSYKVNVTRIRFQTSPEFA